jgi:hypothetical protein
LKRRNFKNSLFHFNKTERMRDKNPNHLFRLTMIIY